jgi:hypothetical protein
MRGRLYKVRPRRRATCQSPAIPAAGPRRRRRRQLHHRKGPRPRWLTRTTPRRPLTRRQPDTRTRWPRAGARITNSGPRAPLRARWQRATAARHLPAPRSPALSRRDRRAHRRRMASTRLRPFRNRLSRSVRRQTAPRRLRRHGRRRHAAQRVQRHRLRGPWKTQPRRHLRPPAAAMPQRVPSRTPRATKRPWHEGTRRSVPRHAPIRGSRGGRRPRRGRRSRSTRRPSKPRHPTTANPRRRKPLATCGVKSRRPPRTPTAAQ